MCCVLHGFVVGFSHLRLSLSLSLSLSLALALSLSPPPPFAFHISQLVSVFFFLSFFFRVFLCIRGILAVLHSCLMLADFRCESQSTTYSGALLAVVCAPTRIILLEILALQVSMTQSRTPLTKFGRYHNDEKLIIFSLIPVMARVERV